MSVSEAEDGPLIGRGDVECGWEREGERDLDRDLDLGLVSAAGDRERGERPRIMGAPGDLDRDLECEREGVGERERERESHRCDRL